MAKSAVVSTNDSRSKVIKIVDYMSKEDWEFAFNSAASSQSVSLELFDGYFTLHTDGTWDFS